MKPILDHGKLLVLLAVPFFFSLGSCADSYGKNNQSDEALRLQALAYLLESPDSDCVYCSDQQALGGSCTCYEGIKMGSCPGIASGQGKNNSYRISCEDLTSGGTWVTVSEDPPVWSCTRDTCPPEAYRAAFTAESL